MLDYSSVLFNVRIFGFHPLGTVPNDMLDYSSVLFNVHICGFHPLGTVPNDMLDYSSVLFNVHIFGFHPLGTIPNDMLDYSSVLFNVRIFGFHPLGTIPSTVSPAILLQEQKTCLRGVQRNEMVSHAGHDVQHYSLPRYDTLLIGNLLLRLQRALLLRNAVQSKKCYLLTAIYASWTALKLEAVKSTKTPV